MKKLIVINIVVAIGLILIAVLFTIYRRGPEKEVPGWDSVDIYRARFDSIMLEVDERKHDEYIRSRKVDSTIHSKFNDEKKYIISVPDSMDLRVRYSLLRRLDSTKFTY